MTKHERVKATFRRQPVDRVPVALWRHFPVDDQTPVGLAEAVLRFQRKHDFDLVKVTPTADYMCLDWGLQSEYRGGLGGTREVIRRPVNVVDDWDRIRPLDVGRGALGRQLDALRIIADSLAGDAPIVQTIFSPLTTIRKLAGERWLGDLRSNPAALELALAAIAATTMDFARESIRAGADGVFYAIQEASARMMDEADYRRYGEPNDRAILEAVAFSDWNILHLHGEQVLFDLANSFAVAAVNWHDRRTYPNLKEALGVTSKGLIGGLNEATTLLHGSPAEVRAEVVEAVARTGGSGLMVGAGCVIRIDTPEENIASAVAAARSIG